MTGMMKAAVLSKPGAPKMLKLEERPIPKLKDGWTLLKVEAFGLNRSELFTRQGHSPTVMLPRILGIEAVGTVAATSNRLFKRGDRVATAMGGMGRVFDGSYAEFTLVPDHQIQILQSSLDWQTLGSLPEMMQTAWRSLHHSLKIQADDTLLIRGGTTSVGLAAAAIAKNKGLHVIATTRQHNRREELLSLGIDDVIIDDGNVRGPLRALHPNGADKVLELVGTTTLLDSLQCTKTGGIVCMTGMVGNEWELSHFSPMGAIPTGVNLTTYAGGADDFMQTPLQEIVKLIELGEFSPPKVTTFSLDNIVQAHQCMENNEAFGKIVVTP